MQPELINILIEIYPEVASLDDDAREDFWDNLSEQETYKINGIYLTNIGDKKYDYLMCWEPGRFDTDETVLDYNNFYDVDVKWWEFQKSAELDFIDDCKKWMEAGSKDWTPEKVAEIINNTTDRFKEYRIYFSGDWYRLFDGDTFLYAELISAEWFLYYEIETFLDDLEDRHIPHTFRAVDDMMQILNELDPEKRYDASGREKELDAFKNKMRTYLSNDVFENIETVLKEHPELSGKTFRRDLNYANDENFDPSTDFVFFDVQSLKNVRPKNFLEDIKSHQVDWSELEKVIDVLKAIALQDFERIYNANKSRYI